MNDDPHGFEDRALALARAIHDPLGLQGSRMILGKERDGIFVGDDSIHAFEFTTDRRKAKAQKDGAKLVEALRSLGRETGNAYKSLTGWFVTQHEPVADQREAIRALASISGVTLHCVSYVTLRKRICDVEGYLAARMEAPFGSIAYVAQPLGGVEVPPRFHGDGTVLGVADVATRLLEGARLVVTGEFGVGKSFATREIFKDLRKKHFKSPATEAFPIHVNLRDCAGLRTPAEILRRHAEEIGFSGDRGLMSAWRAGSCTLLLDGFDEIIPSRWLGSALNLRQVRWEALSAVRRLVAEAPPGTGILLTGRGHYFASESELLNALSIEGGTLLHLDDFDIEQAGEFLSRGSADLSLPEWLPTRPLLLSHLLAAGLLAQVAGLPLDLEPASAWRALLEMIAQRESNIYASVPPETILSVLRRLATVAKGSGDGLGRLEIADLERVFADVSGRTTDEEVLQLLLRLPGLALGQSGDQEFRLFADEGLASAAYGEDLATYLGSPYQGHPLCDVANWSEGSPDLAIEVCALSLETQGISAAQVLAACDYRMSRSQYDAVLFDAIRSAEEMGAAPRSSSGYIIEGVSIGTLTVGAESAALARAHFRDSVIETLDVSTIEADTTLPTFERCFIGRVEGVSEFSPFHATSFPQCEIVEFTAPSATTAGILSMSAVALDDRVALSILHKVYAKRGSGRKDSALPRGLEPAARERVPAVLSELVSHGLVTTSARGNVTIYLPAKGRRSEVGSYLATPSSFRLEAVRA